MATAQSCAEMLDTVRNNRPIVDIPGVSRKRWQLFKAYFACTRNISEAIKPCVVNLTAACKNSSIVTYKGLRLRMDSVEEFMRDDPDFKVIHFMRDPRATTMSRLVPPVRLSFRQSFRNPINEVKFLCHKVLVDLRASRRLAERYPTRFMFVKYEDVASSPIDSIEDIYDFLDRPIHSNLTEWLNISSSVTRPQSLGVVRRKWQRQELAFNTVRKNWTSSIEKWRRGLSPHIQAKMTALCQEVLEVSGYIQA